MPRLLAPLVLVLVLAASAHAYTWRGTWSSTHGELRIVSIGSLVVGDYADRGTLVGQVSGDRLTGVFTNGGRAGRFDWRHDRDGAFSGTWHWVGETASGAWTGRQASTESPAVTNFSRDGRALRSIANGRDVFDGTYGGTFGTVRLRSRDLVLVGDYGDTGTLAGMWDGSGFVGVFTNGARAGWFDWRFLSRTGAFRSGQWGWAGQAASGEWSLTRTDASAPRLTSLRPPADSPRPAPQPEPRPAPEAHPATELEPAGAFSPNKLKTLLAMQYHVRYVSEADAGDGVEALEDAGFRVHGGTFIDSEASGDLAALFTTGRLRAAVAVRGDDVVITFRGSGGSNGWQTFGNAITDLTGVRSRIGWVRSADGLSGTERNATAHTGFQEAYARLRPDILAAIDAQPGQKNVYVFGHSLGGAMATLCALDLSLNRRAKLLTLTHVASGMPRVGGGRFRALFERTVANNMRVTVHGDPIPNVPRGVPTRLNANGYYRHAGRLLPLTARGTVQTAAQITLSPMTNGLAAHEPDVYFGAVEAYVLAARRVPALLRVDVDALGDAERRAAEED